MRKQNVNLKRQSQMLLQRFQIVDFTVEERDSSAGEDVPDSSTKSEAEDERDVLNRKIKGNIITDTASWKPRLEVCEWTNFF